LTSRQGTSGVALIDLVWQFSRDIAQAAYDRLARKAQQALRVPALLPEVH
jgi:hypothetical protein